MNKKAKDSTKEYKWDAKREMYVPKASPLAYTLFLNERREQVLKENVKEDGKMLSTKQVAKKLRSEWKNLDEDDKRKYLDIVEKEKKRFDAQRKEMDAKGYFILTSGTKSSDIPAPEKKVDKRRSTTPVKQETKRPMGKKKN